MQDAELIRILIEKQDNLMKELNEIKIVLAHQEENLRAHMKRSDMLEQYVTRLEQDIKPVQKHVSFIETGLKITGGTAGLLSSIVGLIKMYEWLHH